MGAYALPMSLAAQGVLYLWIPLCILLFYQLPVHRAIIASLIFSNLFLPEGQIDLSGFPDLDKFSTTSIAIALGLFCKEGGEALKIPLKWWDLPLLVFCISPFFSSITNDLGPWDGFSLSLEHILLWGIPYLAGRRYLCHFHVFREILFAMVISAILYMPLVWFELRMSPILHSLVWGYTHASGVELYRMGGWRPVVFMNHGLILSLWYVFCAFASYGLRQAGLFKQVFGVSATVWTALLFLTAIAFKSLNALLLMAVLGVFFFTPLLLRRIVLICALLFAPAYVTYRCSTDWGTNQLIAFVAKKVSPQRAASLATRLENETLLRDKAMERPLFGWGGWGRSRVYDEQGRDISLTDGLWIVQLGRFGLLGLSMLIGTFLLPLFPLIRGVGVAKSSFRFPVGARLCALFVLMLLVNSMMNAHIPHLFPAIMGALAGLQAPEFAPVASRVSFHTPAYPVRLL